MKTKAKQLLSALESNTEYYTEEQKELIRALRDKKMREKVLNEIFNF